MKIIDKINNDIKNILNKPVSKSSLIYLCSTFLLFVFLCFIMGKPKWIFTMFFGTIFDGFSDDTPNMIANVYLSVLGDFDIGQINELLLPIATSIVSAVPMAIQFSCINGFITKFINIDNKKSEFFIFLASCLLQAIVSLSWTPPLSWNTFMSNGGILGKILVPLILGIVIVPPVYCGIKGINLSDSSIMQILSGPFSIVIKFLQEFIKANIILLPFGMIFGVIWVTLTYVKLSFVANIIGIFTPFIYVLVNNKLGGLIDTFTNKLVLIILKIAYPSFEYHESKYSEIFCFGISILIMIICFNIYFKLI